VSPRSGFRRGFKTEATTIARDIRAELGISSVAPLDPWALAAHLAIPVFTLSEFRTVAPSAYKAFAGRLKGQFSAVTVFDGPTRAIVHNDRHTPQRQRSDLAHELAHCLLFHPATAPIGDRGSREWDATHEREAAWLSATLLVPDDAAVLIARKGQPVKEAAQEYGVSEKLMNYRLRVSGALIRVARYNARLVS
jgi:hypothetical protein